MTQIDLPPAKTTKTQIIYIVFMVYFSTKLVQSYFSINKLTAPKGKKFTGRPTTDKNLSIKPTYAHPISPTKSKFSNFTIRENHGLGWVGVEK